MALYNEKANRHPTSSRVTLHAMNPNYTGLVALGLSLLVFVSVEAKLRPEPVRIRCLFFIVSIFLAVPSFLFAFYYVHLMPEWEWFYELRSIKGSEFLVLFLGAALGASASLLSRRVYGFSLFILLALGSLPYIKPFLSPLPETAFEDRWKGNACLQSTPSTCGPASICSILHYLDQTTTEREVARAAYTGSTGTEAWYLARYAREKGFKTRFRFYDTFIPQAGLPAMVGVRIYGTFHFIAVLKTDGDKITFVDPLVGEECLSLDDFQKRYRFTGFHLWISK